ncbi:MAG: crotonase [Acidobacteria bacterium]|nr:MAG: crotonase [Acidobacteriota bacterium]
MNFETIRCRIEDSIAVITLNRPERMNAFNVRMGNELAEAFAELDLDDEVRVIVVTGEGRAFCAGADLDPEGQAFKAFASRSGEEVRDRPMDPWRLRKPVIAAMNGHAVGVGLTMAMQCDIRFANEDAKYSFAFVRRGVIPELASHVIVPKVVGMGLAAELLLSGRTIHGREAAEIGLVNRAMPGDAVLPAALELAKDIAVNTAPVSVAISKRLLWESIGSTIPEEQRIESSLFAWVSRKPDSIEGVKAFIEKREPRWNLKPSEDLPDWPE